MKRYTRAEPCPICRGYEQMTRGEGKRCHGFASDDGEWVHCSREDRAGDRQPNPKTGTYAHRLAGPCDCGETHGAGEAHQRRRIDKLYQFTDEDGTVLYEEVRYTPKDFRVRRPDGEGGYVYKEALKGVRRVLYRLPAVLAAVDAGDTVYVVEGCKDADRLWDEGVVATTNALGAGKWRDEYTQTLRGADVVVVRDRDDKGRAHGATVAGALRPVAKTLRIVEAAV